MREILFRGKRIDNGEWVEGYYVKALDMYDKEIHAIFDTMTTFYACGETSGFELVDPETICQYTGLIDKNGKKIWENDLVKYLFSDTIAPIRYGSYQSCFDSTKTEHVGFYVDWSVTDKEYMRKDLGYWINMVDAKIVGNKFDNSELLEA